MSARDEFRPASVDGYCSHAVWGLMCDEIDRLRAELTVANNRLGNAVGALIDAGTYCTGVDDVTAGIDRLRAELTAERDVRKQLAARLNLQITTWVDEYVGPLAREVQERRAAEVKQEAIRRTVNCPTCLGSRSERMTQDRCPDCTDGKIDMARLLAVGAAVFAASVVDLPDRLPRYNKTIFGFNHGVDSTLRLLRQVRP